MELGFSSYDGGQFLWFYAALLLAAVIASLWLPGRLRPEGGISRPRDPEALAYLGGGTARFADAVIASLTARKLMRVEAGKLVATTTEGGETEAERALLRDYTGYGWNQVLRELAPHGFAVKRELEERGMLAQHGDRTRLRLLPVLPYVLVLLVGLYRLQAGMAEGEPVGFLLALLVLTVVLAIVRFARFNPRTHAGEEAIAKAMADAERLRGAPTSGEVGLAVSLFGTAVLVGTPYASLHAMRNSGSGADGGAGADGGSDGGGGCGGGGCGGCGG